MERSNMFPLKEFLDKSKVFKLIKSGIFDAKFPLKEFSERSKNSKFNNSGAISRLPKIVLSE